MRTMSEPRIDKQERRRRIRDVVARNDLRTQDELRELLIIEGVHATQATLSRDLRELGITKGKDGYRLPPTDERSRAAANGLARLMRGRVLRVDSGGTTVVLRTRHGEASSIADELGGMDMPQVLGVIAGVDTVFIATHSASQARALERVLRRFV